MQGGQSEAHVRAGYPARPSASPSSHLDAALPATDPQPRSCFSSSSYSQTTSLLSMCDDDCLLSSEGLSCARGTAGHGMGSRGLLVNPTRLNLSEKNSLGQSGCGGVCERVHECVG